MDVWWFACTRWLRLTCGYGQIRLGHVYPTRASNYLRASFHQSSEGVLTHVSWSPTGGGHHVPCSLHLRQAKVTDHDLGVVVGAEVEQVLRLITKQRVSQMSLCIFLASGHLM